MPDPSPPETLVLASGSAARAATLRAEGLAFEVMVPRVDEAALKESMVAEGRPPRDVADALAEMKAARISGRRPDALVLGCDQVLDLDGRLLSKPETIEDARAQVEALAGRTHRLHSAAVAYSGGAPVWRHVGEARLTMRRPSGPWLDGYLARNWETVRHSVGGYLIEAEGVRLIERVEGDHFTVLGLPLLPLLSFLAARGTIPS